MKGGFFLYWVYWADTRWLSTSLWIRYRKWPCLVNRKLVGGAGFCVFPHDLWSLIVWLKILKVELECEDKWEHWWRNDVCIFPGATVRHRCHHCRMLTVTMISCRFCYSKTVSSASIKSVQWQFRAATRSLAVQGSHLQPPRAGA